MRQLRRVRMNIYTYINRWSGREQCKSIALDLHMKKHNYFCIFLAYIDTFHSYFERFFLILPFGPPQLFELDQMSLMIIESGKGSDTNGKHHNDMKFMCIANPFPVAAWRFLCGMVRRPTTLITIASIAYILYRFQSARRCSMSLQVMNIEIIIYEYISKVRHYSQMAHIYLLHAIAWG